MLIFLSPTFPVFCCSLFFRYFQVPLCHSLFSLLFLFVFVIPTMLSRHTSVTPSMFSLHSLHTSSLFTLYFYLIPSTSLSFPLYFLVILFIPLHYLLYTFPSFPPYFPVIPAKAGIQYVNLLYSSLLFFYEEMCTMENLKFFNFMFRIFYCWIPAFAGMTEGYRRNDGGVSQE